MTRADHLYPRMSTVHENGHGQFRKGNEIPRRSRIATDCLQEHSSDFENLRCPPHCRDWTSLSTSGMPCYELLRGYLHPLVLLRIYGQPAGCVVPISSMSTADISLVLATSICDTSVYSQGLHGITHVFQFLWPVCDLKKSLPTLRTCPC